MQGEASRSKNSKTKNMATNFLKKQKGHKPSSKTVVPVGWMSRTKIVISAGGDRGGAWGWELLKLKR